MPWNPKGNRYVLDRAEQLILMGGLGAAVANDLRRAAMQIDQPGWDAMSPPPPRYSSYVDEALDGIYAFTTNLRRHGMSEDGITRETVKDFLDEMVVERTEDNPEFPRLLEEAEKRRREKTDWVAQLEKATPKKHHVACDLDGTLAHFDGWKGIEHIGKPIPYVLARVKALLEAGHQVSIYTSRVAGDWPENIKDLEATRRHIERWCYEHIGRILPITAVKHGWFTEFWDDKALGIRENQGMPVTTRDAWLAFGPGRI